MPTITVQARVSSIKLISMLMGFSWYSFEYSDAMNTQKSLRAKKKKIDLQANKVCVEANSRLGWELVNQHKTLTMDRADRSKEENEEIENHLVGMIPQVEEEEVKAETEKFAQQVEPIQCTCHYDETCPVEGHNQERKMTSNNPTTTTGMVVGGLVDKYMGEGMTLVQAIDAIRAKAVRSEEKAAHLAKVERMLQKISFPHKVSKETSLALVWTRLMVSGKMVSRFHIEKAYYEANRDRMQRFMGALQVAFNAMPDREARFVGGFLEVKEVVKTKAEEDPCASQVDKY